MTQEEKARRYDEALERAGKLQETCDSSAVVGWMEYIFPELAESEDEKMMNQLHSWMKEFGGAEEYTKKVYNWIKGLLERQKAIDNLSQQEAIDIAVAKCFEQDTQKPIGKVEPKFKVGDKITYIGERKELIADNKYTIKEISKNCYISTLGNKIPFSMQEYYTIVNNAKFKVGDWITDGRYTKLVVVINSDWPYYMFIDGTSKRIKDIDKKYHLWSIEDAKDGDVLMFEDEVFILKNYTLWNKVVYHCCYDQKNFFVHDIYALTKDDFSKIHPATKEQRDILFQKMKEAGYMWNAEKKELKLLITNSGNFFESENCEQNPAWGEGDDAYKLFAIPAVEDYYCEKNPLRKGIVDWLNSLKERMGGKL